MGKRATGWAIGLASAVIACASPALAETRCGWFVNPTPGDFWLVDAEGEWDIAWQGEERPPGFDAMPDMSRGGWVETNGYHGYGCGCVSGLVDHEVKRFLRIDGGVSKSLAVCRADRRLPAVKKARVQ